MKKLLLSLLLIAIPLGASAQLVPISVKQGGTGWGNPGGFQSGYVIYGNGTSPLATSTGLKFTTSTLNLNFSYGSTTAFTISNLAGSGTRCVQTDNNGFLSIAAAACGTGGSAFPFTVNTGYNSTSTVIGFNGLFSTASSTFSNNLFLSSLTQGFNYVGSNGLLNTIASSSVKLSWFNNDSGFLTSHDEFPTHPSTGVSATTSQVNFVGFLSTASSTIVGNATTTGSFYAGTATSSATFGSGLSSCTGSNFLQWTSGVFGCATSSGSGTVNTGSAGYLAYYNTTGTAVSPTSTAPLYVDAINATSSTATSTIRKALRLGGTAAARDELLQVDCSDRAWTASVSVGGCVNIDGGTVNSGSLLTVRGAFGSGATGRGVVFNNTNSAFDQDWILASSSAANTSTLNIKGAPTGKGVLKIEHTGNLGDANANSSGMSIDLLACGLCQGFFIDSTLASTSGNLANFRNKGQQLFTIDAVGRTGVGSSSPYAQLSVRSMNAATTTFALNSYPSQTADIMHIQDGTVLAFRTQAGGFSTTTLSGLNISGSATSTSNVGFNITTGCYAIGGTCISGGSSSGLSSYNAWPLNQSSTVSGTSTLIELYGNASSTGFSSNYGFFGGTSLGGATSTITTQGLLGLGTTTFLGGAEATISTTTTPQLNLRGDIGNVGWSFRNIGNILYFATTSPTTKATSTNSSLSVIAGGLAGYFGFGTTTPAATIDVKGSIVSEEASSTSFTATPTFDWSLSTQNDYLMTGNITSITFTNGQRGGAYRLILCQDSAGSRTVTGWDSNILWAGGTIPTQTATANKCDLYTFTATFASTTKLEYLGGYVQNF